LEALRQLARSAQCEEVPAVDLVGDDAQAFPRDAPLERRREEKILAADENPRRNLGPGTERPRLSHRRHRLLRLATLEAFGGNLRRDVMKVKDPWIAGGFGREPDGFQEVALRCLVSSV